MKYVIATVEGPRIDIAPEYKGVYGKIYRYASFILIIHTCGDYDGTEYDTAYGEISNYVRQVNDELRNNRYCSGLFYAELLTPKERNEYNDTRCRLFHNWIVDKMINCEEIIAHQIRVVEKDLNQRISPYNSPESVMKLARQVSGEMLARIECPGDFLHTNMVNQTGSIYLKNYPIFEFGWNLTLCIQLVDRSSFSHFNNRLK